MYKTFSISNLQCSAVRGNSRRAAYSSPIKSESLNFLSDLLLASVALFHLPITLFSFTSTSNVRNHLKNKLLFFQRVLVGIQCAHGWRLEAVIFRNAIHLLWNRASFWPEAYQLTGTLKSPVPRCSDHRHKALWLTFSHGCYEWKLGSLEVLYHLCPQTNVYGSIQST